MHNPLSQRCFKTIGLNSFLGDYSTVLKALLVENEFLPDEVHRLIETRIQLPIKATDDIYSCLKEFVILLFLHRFGRPIEDVLKKRVIDYYETLKLHPQAFNETLAVSYLALIGALLEQDISTLTISTLPSGFVVTGVKELSPYGDQIQLHQQIEISLNLLLIALLNKDLSMASIAGKMISAFAHCLDDDGKLLVGLWSQSVLRDKSPFFALLFLTIYTFNQISPHPILENAIHIQSNVIAHFSNEDIQHIGSFACVLSFAIDQILNVQLHELVHDIKFDEKKEVLFQDVGLVVDKLGNYSTYLTLSGINHSIGSILSKDVKVIAMGPHFFPLGDLSKFGIYHLIDKEQKIPVTFERSDEKTLIKGLTKLLHADSNRQEVKPSDTWLELEILNQVDKLKLTISLSGEPCKLPLSFVFFIKSKETEMIGNHVLKPKTLDKYVGPSQKVVFKGSNKNLTILPCFEEKMHLIPLEGKEHFWGADYLLACEISQFQKKYSWEFQ
jgi:hypothetical protein